MRATLPLVLLLALPAVAACEEYADRRMEMIEEIRQMARMTGEQPIGDRVLDAVNEVERHEFVPPELVPFAYENGPLPIGHEQTISQPYIVALMTELLETEPDHVVLEVGTGSGYQAAVLAKLVKHVYSIEIIEALAQEATERLERLGYDNVTTMAGDGYAGWPEHAPFDGIIVTAAAGHVPPPLVEQLKPGARMVIPVGRGSFSQELLVIEKKEDGEVVTHPIIPVRFVPLTGDH